MKRVKNSIGEKEFKKLLIHTRGIDNIKEHTRQNLLRTFVILYYTGLRLNEVQSLRISHIKQLVEENNAIVETSKTNAERKLFASFDFAKERGFFHFDQQNGLKLFLTSGCLRSDSELF